MANVIQKATNTWSKGMVLDFSPENTSNEVLTHALNATLLTFNGNEYSLQNDMGNARVETAYLPEGYIPIGTCEFGGIIYIVSYNPLEDKSQIGCFPSPERNVSNTEMGLAEAIIQASDFQEIDMDGVTGKLNNTSHRVILKNDPLNPGDKFIITAQNFIYEERLADLQQKLSLGKFKSIEHPIIKLNVVSINDSGKITYLNSDLRNYATSNYNYYILGTEKSMPQQTDIDNYRNVISSGYNVFKSKTSGKLAILAELIMIDSYSVTHSIEPKFNTETEQWEYNIYLHHEISPEVNSTNYLQVPKLKYYYLEKSKGLFSIPTKDYEISFNPTNIHDEDDPNKNYIKLSEFIKSTSLTDADNITGNDFKGFQNEGMYYYKYKDDTVYYLPDENTEYKYEDVLLGTVIMPEIINNNTNLSLPFTYEYTIVPCMEYGKLDHLKVSNTINFQNLHNFDQSKINTWKYYLENNLLRLTFGAEVYDTFESNKVDAIILEFYDAEGFAGSYTCANKKSYSGVFTTTFTLNTINQLNTKKIEQVGNTFELVDGQLRNINLRKISNTSLNVTYKNNDNLSVIFYNVPKYMYGPNTYIKLNQDLFNEYADNAKYLAENEDGTHSPINDDDKATLKKVQIVEGYYIIGDASVIGDLNNAIPNDCGTLYSNLIYKIIPYFRQPNADGTFNYIQRNELYLFTFPIYNQYYYTVDNFNALTKPELDIVLTYQLKDNSNCNIYNNDDNNIINGYNSVDKEKIDKYYSGTYEESSLEATRYYSYKGTSELYLEIGLHEQYAYWGLSSKKELNDNFTCDLQLMGSDNESTYNVTNSENLPLDSNNTLNIIDGKPISSLGFNENKLSNITVNKLSTYNFLSKTPTTPININYEFIAGYKFKITDMVPTAIPTTTVCALCHQVNDSQYNYADFGIREETINKDTQYLSDRMIYNTGTRKTTEVGFGRQIHRKLWEETDKKFTDYIDTSRIVKSGNVIVNNLNPLNAHHTLQEIIPKIGKLTFCQPHIHSINEDLGVNIHRVRFTDENMKNYDYFYLSVIQNYTNRLNVDEDDHPYEDSYGSLGSRDLYDWPYFNLSINTKDSILYQTEFISTISEEKDIVKHQIPMVYGKDENPLHWDRVQADTFRLNLFNTLQVAAFNRYLLNTMKQVYAYNPDYDTTVFNKGQVNMQNYHPIFNSNLLIRNADLNITDDFNKYININNNGLEEYLTKLVGSNIPQQLQFSPNLKYCGKDVMLLTSLTYNTPIPQTLIDELNFNPNSLIVVRQHDGTVKTINGNIDKKTLYGYDSEQNILQAFNLANYSINNTGEVSLITKSLSNNIVPSNNIIPMKPVITDKYTSSDKLEIISQDIKPNAAIFKFNHTNFCYELCSGESALNSECRIVETLTFSDLKPNTTYTLKYKLTAKDAYNDFVNFTTPEPTETASEPIQPRFNTQLQNLCLVGTSIKLTDLEYDPTQKHRLFVKRNTYTLLPQYKICYRKVFQKTDDPGVLAAWDDDYKWNENIWPKMENVLQLYTGPHFTTINEDPIKP